MITTVPVQARFGTIAAVVKLPDRNNLNRSLPEAKEIVMPHIPRIRFWTRRLTGSASALLALTGRAMGPA